MVDAQNSSSAVDGNPPPSFHLELQEWSTGRANWQRHALWMLATKAEITDAEFHALENCLMREVGLLKPEGVQDTLFEAAHLKSKAAADVRLLSVSNIDNVNRLDPKGLTFSPKGLTVVYGDNGSGKTGFIRVLRKACRSRIERPQDLEILANVYGSVSGSAAAKFTINDGGTEIPIDWCDGSEADRRLSAFSVFDTRSAQLYVDEGNKLRFLPADLDLPFRLNDIIQKVEDRLAPKLSDVQGLLDAYVVPFEAVERDTSARRFFSNLSIEATDEEIEKACLFTPEDQTELDGLVHALNAGPDSVAELKRNATAVRTLAQRINGLNAVFTEQKRAELSAAWAVAVAARTAHEASKSLIDGKDPLPGVGAEVWVRLWRAAQEYAAVADAHHHFPEDGPRGSSGEALCPLCQQSSAGATERLARFHSFMSSETATTLSSAEGALTTALEKVSATDPALSDAEVVLLGSVRSLDADLAALLEARFALAKAKRTAWLAFQGTGDLAAALDDSDLGIQLAAVAGKADALAQTVSLAQDEAARAVLVERRNALEDRRCLSPCGQVLRDRRDALKRHKGLKTAVSSCRRQEVTRQANKWVDVHLTKEAKRVFTEHLTRFKLQHLNVELERQSSSVGTGFKNRLQARPQGRRLRLAAEAGLRR